MKSFFKKATPTPSSFSQSIRSSNSLQVPKRLQSNRRKTVATPKFNCQLEIEEISPTNEGAVNPELADLHRINSAATIKQSSNPPLLYSPQSKPRYGSEQLDSSMNEFLGLETNEVNTMELIKSQGQRLLRTMCLFLSSFMIMIMVYSNYLPSFKDQSVHVRLTSPAFVLATSEFVRFYVDKNPAFMRFAPTVIHFVSISTALER